MLRQTQGQRRQSRLLSSWQEGASRWPRPPLPFHQQEPARSEGAHHRQAGSISACSVRQKDRLTSCYQG